MNFLPRFLPCAAAMGLALAGSVGADTIVLKSGEKVEGKVVKETEGELTIEYKASASITDTRVVAKSEVATVQKEAPDEVAFLAVKNLKPGANSLSAAGYEQSIRALQDFLDQFPQSAHAGEITPQLEAFLNEQKRVAGGELKLFGRWISKEDVEREKYQLSGQALLGQMQDLARRGDLVGSLNVFDQLERSFPGSGAYPDAIELARQAVAQLKPAAERALQTWLAQKKERDAATQLLVDPQRSEVLAAQNREQQQFEQLAAAGSKTNVKWPPFLARHENSLRLLASKAVPEARRLEALPVAKMRESIQATDAARVALAAGDTATAEAKLKEAKSAWNANEAATRLDRDLRATLTASAAPPKVEATTPALATTPKPAATPARAAAPAAAVEPVFAPAEEKKNFFATPLGIGLCLAILGGLLFVYLKTRGARVESETAAFEEQIAERERLEEERKKGHS